MPTNGRLRQFARRRPLVTFFSLALGLGWIVALPLVLSPAGLGLIPIELPEEWLMLFACTPTVAALWTQWLAEGNFRICRLGSPWTRVVLGAVGGVVVVMTGLAIVPALLLSSGAIGALNWSALLTSSVGWWANPFNLLGGPLNEEPGWRGFALPRLQTRYGPLTASLLLGLLWAAWHIPLFLVQGWLGVPIWAYVLLTVCMSVLMTWMVNRSAGSIITAILMHAVYNSSFAIMAGLCRGVPTREPGLIWYVTGVVLATLLVMAATRGRLGNKSVAALDAPAGARVS